VLKMTLN